jgi:hypothetical protein
VSPSEIPVAHSYSSREKLTFGKYGDTEKIIVTLLLSQAPAQLASPVLLPIIL